MILTILQLIISIVLVILILLQERSAGLSGIFGGEGGFYQTRRGLEKIIFRSTILLAALFMIIAIIQLVS
ncbi:MAG: preprotein translocase subunit SecG [Candidatus Liptonbacteria bacterium]|nr:preprotein translocase subunit SecG [Candidatus Liptonbacteria bacterium]